MARINRAHYALAKKATNASDYVFQLSPMIVRSFRSEVVLVPGGQVSPTADLQSDGGMVCFETFRRLVRWRGAGNYGFTLVELLVVIAVIAVLATLGSGALSRMSLSAGTTKSANQMLQIHRAALLWANDNNGRLPMPANAPRDEALWYVVTYPYLMNGQQHAPGFFVPWDTAANLKGTPFYCPLKDRSDEGTPVRSYAWNNRLKDMTVLPRRPLPLARVKQPSKTMMLVTSKLRSSIDYTRENFDGYLSTRCGEKALVLFVDGHVEKRAKEEIPLSSSDPFWIP